MNDCNLIQEAARAAGIFKWRWLDGRFQKWGIADYSLNVAGWEYWEPQSNDGDALRLSRARKMTITHEPSRGGWSVGAVVCGEFKWLAHEDDDQKLAIVRAAAAAVGKTGGETEATEPGDVAALQDRLVPLSFEQLDEAAREAQIKFCLKGGRSFEEEFARAIERAHGIGA